MFEWKPEYCVGIHSIDGQHQNLFAAARELQAALNGAQSKLVVGRLLDRLIRYTVIHFGHEERLLAQSGYPDLANHKRQHTALAEQVAAFERAFEQGGVAAEEVLHFLMGWLGQHIQERDQAYAPFVKARACQSMAQDAGS